MGSPIIISPVMTQNVGDVSATSHDAADHKLVEETPRQPQRPVSSEEDADKDVEILAESHHQIVPRNGAVTKGNLNWWVVALRISQAND